MATGNVFDDNGAGEDNDPDGDTLVVNKLNGEPVTQVVGTDGGLFTINPDGSYTFDTSDDFVGMKDGETRTTSVEYTIDDGEGGTDTATLSIDVEGVTDPAIAVDDYRQTPSDTPISVNVQANDVNPDDLPLSVVILSTDPGGEAEVTTDGVITFTPDAEFTGTVNIEYLLEDSTGSTSIATLTIDVQPPYTFDSFHEFSKGFESQLGGTATPEKSQAPSLTRQIFTLAPEPIFSGYSRPGTEVVGRIYDQSGNLVGEGFAQADPGGNWMMHFQGVSKFEHYRIEIEYAVTSTDIYGYLGLNPSDNSYQAMQPLTGWDKPMSVEGAIDDAPHETLTKLHNENNRPQGLGTNEEV